MKILFTVAVVSALALCSSSTADAARHLSSSSSSSSSMYQRTVTGGEIEGMADAYYPEISVWKGIPYAAPPTGSNRFLPTQDVVSWSGVKKTQAFSAGCIQTCNLPRPSITCPAVQSEDCLYLNVYSPVNQTNSTEKLPVFFFIHGGAFSAGAGGVDLYESARLAQTQNMVVVTINYRLGIFGALYMGEDCQGNFMIQDQRKAMQWVQANIGAFGGDKNRVTIGGQSAGAMSTGIHMVAPKSAGLFHGAIMSSNPYGLPYTHPTLATQLGQEATKKLGCEFGTPSGMKCLQTLDAEVIQNVSHTTRLPATPAHALMALVPWVPVAETPNEIPQQPLQAVLAGNFTRVPVLMGNNANDSVLFINQLSAKPISNVELDIELAWIFGLANTIEIKEKYGPIADKKDARIYFSEIGTDYIFYCPITEAAGAFSKYLAQDNKKIYQYLFNHLPSFSEWLWEGNTPLCENYICHADDLPFVFGAFYVEPASAPMPTAEELKLTTYMQSVYGTFVHKGDLETAPITPKWSGYDPKVNELMSIQTPVSGGVINYHESKCDLLNKIGYSRE